MRKEEKDTTSVYTSARDEKLSAQVSEYNVSIYIHMVPSSTIGELYKKKKKIEKS